MTWIAGGSFPEVKMVVCLARSRRVIVSDRVLTIGGDPTLGRGGVGCGEYEADQQRHGEHDGWQVPDKVQAAVDGERGHRRDHPSPGSGGGGGCCCWVAGGARAPQQARDRDQQNREQTQADQAELRVAWRYSLWT